MKSKKNVKNKKIFKIRLADIIIVVAILALLIYLINVIKSNYNKSSFKITPEIARSREYNVVNSGEERTNSEYVKFDAFFLKDLDGDGNADSIRGACNEVGKQDTLYMELKVINNGHLKNGEITINSDNFYLSTTIVKDNVIAQNYISNNTKQIKLNDIQNGIQRLLTGIVRSGDYTNPSTKTEAIGNDTKKYSKVNSITFTGTHVSDNGKETKINKTVNFAVDWYGTVTSKINTTSVVNKVNKFDELIDENNIKLSFEVKPSEIDNDLILKANYLEGTIPELNGYKPTSVEIQGQNVEYTYNEETNEFKAKKEAIIDSNKVVTKMVDNSREYDKRYNTYKFNLIYPKEAYEDIDNTNIELFIPIRTWYEGYNNPNNQFANPYISNVSETTIVARWEKNQGFAYKFGITVGKYSSFPYNRYVVSKEKPIKIYNNISTSEKEDFYTVKWELKTGTERSANKVVMKETKNGESQVSDIFVKTDSSTESMKDLTNNVGIYFIGQESMLGENGWIKVYNDETNELIENFNKENWNNYNETNPYKYTQPIKHIRIETSSTNKEQLFAVYNIKELDDKYITTNYTKDEFDDFQHIKSTLNGYFDSSSSTKTHTAVYEAPLSLATISISQNKFSTQETATNQVITIKADSLEYNIQKWKNGIFLVKLPNEIIHTKINSINITNNNVNLKGYDLYEENGSYFIKIITENEEEQTYSIAINCDITPDPRETTVNRNIELYAINDIACEYAKNYKSADTYDIDEDSNKTEIINKDKVRISIISPNYLLTHQMALKYNEKNDVTVAPRIAEVEKQQRTADIEISLSNNYAQDISDVLVQGVIPFEGNKYILGNGDLESSFTTNMSNKGITVPTELKDVVKVYYSTEERPTNDLNDANNKWNLSENVTDWSKIKTYIIDFGKYTMTHGEKHNFTYQINIPEGIEYNKIAYSEHAVYFSLITDEGKYATSTAPNKLGFMIAKKYDLEITKYQEDTEKLLPEITFTVEEDGKEEGKVKSTNSSGKFKITGLYAERTYILKEIKTTKDYVLNENEIKIYTYTDEQNKLHLAYKEDNGTYSNLEDKYSWIRKADVTKKENEDYKVQIELENEVKTRLKIIKVDAQSNEKLSDVIFNIKGEGINTTERTDENGELIVSGLYQDEIYEITEIRRQGYYQLSPVKFKILNNNGVYLAQIIEGNIKSQSVKTIDSIPEIELTLENEKIPTYSLQITKVEEKHEDKTLANTEFLFKEEDDESTKKITTDKNGTILIENLYQHINGKAITGKYTIKETKAPNGYASNQEEISFVVSKNGDKLEINVENESNLTSFKSAEVEGNTVKLVLQDKPLFRLTKTDKETGNSLANVKFVIYELAENGTEIDFAKDVNGNYVGTLNSKNQYEVISNEEGIVSIPLKNGIYKAIEIEAPKGYEKDNTEKYFKISGTEENEEIGTPDVFENTLEINYIEDLLDLAQNVNNGNTYSGTKVILKRTLDFRKSDSYRDASSKTYGDYNLNGIVSDIKTELTTGIGFRGIGIYNYREENAHPFSGIFDGQENEINGIYIDNTENAALFRYVKDGKIKGLGTGGRINSSGSNTSGLVSYGNNIEIYNCYNNCNIKGRILFRRISWRSKR